MTQLVEAQGTRLEEMEKEHGLRMREAKDHAAELLAKGVCVCAHRTFVDAILCGRKRSPQRSFWRPVIVIFAHGQDMCAWWLVLC